MIDRGQRKRPVAAAAILVALLAGSAARANGDHTTLLPPPDPGPALAKIEAAARQAAAQPSSLPPPPLAVATEPGHAIFSPFSESTAASPSNGAVAPIAASNDSDTMFTLFGVLGALAMGGYLWRSARHVR
jgi:hypothetical protein